MPGHPDIQDLTISDDGIELIKSFESWFPDAYLDPVKVPTIGWGHTAGVQMGDSISEAEGEAFLHDDLRETEGYLHNCVKVPLTQHQFDVCTSLTFNMGIGNLLKSEFLMLLNRGQYAAACAQLGRLTHGKDRETGEVTEFEGLVRRRAAEMALWNLPDHVPSDKSPISPPIGKGEGGIKPDKPKERPDAMTEMVTQSRTVQSLLTAVSSLVVVVGTMLEPLKKNPSAAIVLGIAFAGIGGALVFKWKDTKAGR